MAKRYDSKGGPELWPLDDDCLIGIVDDAGVRISNPRTDHGTILGFDHIHHFTSDATRGTGYGFLTLTVQIHIGGSALWIDPNVTPSN